MRHCCLVRGGGQRRGVAHRLMGYPVPSIMPLCDLLLCEVIRGAIRERVGVLPLWGDNGKFVLHSPDSAGRLHIQSFPDSESWGVLSITDEEMIHKVRWSGSPVVGEGGREAEECGEMDCGPEFLNGDMEAPNGPSGLPSVASRAAESGGQEESSRHARQWYHDTRGTPQPAQPAAGNNRSHSSQRVSH